MFKVGEEYQFRAMEDGSECRFGGEVIEVDGPLIKLSSQGGLINEQIINTLSSSFISAELQPHRSDEQKAEARKRFQLLIKGQ